MRPGQSTRPAAVVSEEIQMPFAAPLELESGRVLPAWIAYNGHMNIAYYLVAFDLAYVHFMDAIGVDADFREQIGGSLFTAELHVTYKRELDEGAPYRITAQLLGHDRKRVHVFLYMHHAEEGFLAATVEIMDLYVDLASRRVSEMHDEIHRRLAELLAAHGDLPRPPEAGHAIAMPPSRPA
jgi:acyl-CoA thioester hydrolase